MTEMELGQLKKVELRKVWKNEARDFTTWLALEENLNKLSDEIGIEISLEQTEANVGKFNVDILAREEGTDRMIIIENQLEATNHDHLGKLITYASGHDAEVNIWVVKQAREEHKQAVDWLNEHTDDKANFFIVRVEVWQIDNSKLAPKFQVVSSPNEWAKTIKKSAQQTQLTDTKLMQLEFWTEFRDYLINKKSKLRPRKAHPQHWFDMTFGHSKAQISLTMNTKTDEIACEIYVHDSKEVYNGYFEKKDKIEKELGMELVWMGLPGKKASRIKIIKGSDLDDRKSWNEEFDWMMKTAEAFQAVFTKYK